MLAEPSCAYRLICMHQKIQMCKLINTIAVDLDSKRCKYRFQVSLAHSAQAASTAQTHTFTVALFAFYLWTEYSFLFWLNFGTKIENIHKIAVRWWHIQYVNRNPNKFNRLTWPIDVRLSPQIANCNNMWLRNALEDSLQIRRILK